jgi:membrane associated rhomboid family serine protease
MNGFGKGLFGIPPIVKNLIFINAIMLLAYYAVDSVFGINLNRILGLYFPKSELFKPIQLITHMFMHADFWHLFFNMYALYIFGAVLENVWGPKRFLIYYFVCGLGAVAIHESVIAFQFYHLAQSVSVDNLQIVINEGTAYLSKGLRFDDPTMFQLQELLNTPTIGASGAIFGILLAFGMLFPNTQLMIIFPPIPIRAKYFVMIYGGIELALAVTQHGSQIAHAAHLGGMLFGYLLIRYWRKTTNTLY